MNDQPTFWFPVKQYGWGWGRIRLSLFTFGAMFFVSFATTAVQAQDDAPERRDCLVLRPLESMRAVDDKTILFFMRGPDGEIFRNDVQGVCRGLERNRSISYQTTSVGNPRLCRSDLITVEETGVACRLGEFRLISADEAENLTRERSDAKDANAAKKPEVSERNRRR